jgi:NAD(P)-dependent dehydrogenase (short-subunit alcohol dehydrogenase family)
MARVFITGSSDGLGLMAARLLLEEGHTVVAHARSGQRAEETRTALPDAEQVVTGDLSSIAQTRDVAAQVNALGGVDAVIYNAGVGPYEQRRIETADGLSHVFDFRSRDLYRSGREFELMQRALGFAALATLTFIPLLILVAAAGRARTRDWLGG